MSSLILMLISYSNKKFDFKYYYYFVKNIVELLFLQLRNLLRKLVITQVYQLQI